MAEHRLKKGYAAPLEGGAVGPLIGVLKLGLALATLGVLSKLAMKMAGPGPGASPGFSGTGFSPMTNGYNATYGFTGSAPGYNVSTRPGSSFVGQNQRNGIKAPAANGPSTPRPN